MKLCFKLKLIIALLLTVLCITTFSCNVFAEDYLDPVQFDDSSYNIAQPVQNGITKILMPILALVRYIALGWAIIMAIMIAIKYMSGSAQIKSQLKVDMPTYCIGAVILFGAAGLLRLIQYFVEDNFKK